MLDSPRVAPPTRSSWLLAAAAALSLAACGGAGRTAPAAHAPSGPHPAFVRVLAAADIDGVPATRHLVAGEPTVFVVFASWCGHCRRELAILDELRTSQPRVHVIGVNAYEEWEQASDDKQLRAYLAASAPWLPVVRSDDALLHELGGVPKIPSVYVFDGRGRLTHRFARHERAAPSLAELRQALGQGGQHLAQ